MYFVYYTQLRRLEGLAMAKFANPNEFLRAGGGGIGGGVSQFHSVS